MSLDSFFQVVIDRHREQLERGEHDEQCEWRESGFFLCNCKMRARIATGFTGLPTEELYFPPPSCPRRDRGLDNDDGDWQCAHCHVRWNQYGADAEFTDDNGDLATSLAEWEARRAAVAAAAQSTKEDHD